MVTRDTGHRPLPTRLCRGGVPLPPRLAAMAECAAPDTDWLRPLGPDSLRLLSTKRALVATNEAGMLLMSKELQK